ncbi:MAG: hypothetical protein KAJ19_29820 [Gammaproteobacteria bacterium]|nr:hypothetical protein [Gammaproteobacteria bacterium]
MGFATAFLLSLGLDPELAAPLAGVLAMVVSLGGSWIRDRLHSEMQARTGVVGVGLALLLCIGCAGTSVTRQSCEEMVERAEVGIVGCSRADTVEKQRICANTFIAALAAANALCEIADEEESESEPLSEPLPGPEAESVPMVMAMTARAPEHPPMPENEGKALTACEADLNNDGSVGLDDVSLARVPGRMRLVLARLGEVCDDAG